MQRYVGVRNKNICVVSNEKFISDGLIIVEVKKEFDHITDKELLSDYKFRDNTLVPKCCNKSAKELKVAFITNWKMKCGISTFAESLYPEIIKHIGDYKLFIEKNDQPTEQIDIHNDKISVCWERGKSLKELIKQVKEYDPDVVLINHEFGIFPDARYWISMMNQLSEYRVITTMHSVFHHKDKTIVEASIPEIVVHLEGAVKLLKEEKGIPGKVVVIPHGSSSFIDKTIIWNFYKSEHIFIQAGFGFSYKGLENSILATSILKKKYDDVYFTCLFSESQYNKEGHQAYYDRLMKMVEELDLQENIGIIRGFQSEQTLNSYYKMNKAAVFPYISHPEHEVWGASGAARFAMSKNIPVITSNINHFSDLPTIKANTPEELANKIDEIFSNKDVVKNQLAIQEEYLNSNSWDKIAAKYIDLFEDKT